MGRLVQTNQFDLGMVKDIHPIMTPNNVMTDCLNGTLVSYNGNDFVLQNDMGNYAFNYGALSNGFVPVGLKEHGGILYIISYNPIEDKVEVGSFPSQKTIFSSKDGDTGAALSPIEPSFENKFEKFTGISKGGSLTILGQKNDDFYLNPGDKYILAGSVQNENDNNGYSEFLDKLKELENWQHLTTYVLTADNKLYDISSYINIKAKTTTWNREDFEYIKWEIPGWLAAQFSINVMDEFTANFSASGTEVIDQGDGTYKVKPGGTLKLTTFWDNRIYDEKVIKSIQENLVFIYINKEENIEELYNITKEGAGKLVENEDYKIIGYNNISLLDYNSQQDILYYNDANKDYLNYNFVVPALLVNGTYIVYNQFIQSISTNEQEIDPNKISWVDDIYKYYVGDGSVTLTFDYTSYPGLTLKYQLYRIPELTVKGGKQSSLSYIDNKDEYKEHGLPVYDEYQEFESPNYNGQNILDLMFTTTSEYDAYKYNQEKSIYNKYNQNASGVDINTGIKAENGVVANTFDKEDVYYIRFIVSYTGTDENNKPEDKVIKSSDYYPLYASEIINAYYYIYRDYNSITAEAFANKAVEKFNINNKISVNKTSDKSIATISGGINEFKVPLEEVVCKGDDYNEFYKTAFEDEELNKISLDSVKTNYSYYAGAIPADDFINGNITIKDGKIFDIAKIDSLELNLPKNQYGVIGRLWRNVVSNYNDSVIVDSKNNRYNTTEIDGNISYIYADRYNINVTSNRLERVVATKALRVSEVSSTHNRYGNKITTDSDGIMKIAGSLEFSKVDGRAGYGLGNDSTPSNFTYRFRFIDNTLQYAVQEQWSNFEANKYPVKTGYFGGTTWIIKNDGTKATHSWAKMSSDVTKYTRDISIVALTNKRKGQWKSSYMNSQLFNSNNGPMYVAIYVPGGTKPWILYPSNSFPIVGDDLAYDEALLSSLNYAIMAMLALENYVRVAESVGSVAKWYPVLTLIPDPKNDLILKSLEVNMGVSLGKNYYSELYNRNTLFSSIEEQFMKSYVWDYVVPINQTISINNRSDVVSKVISKLVLDVNTKSGEKSNEYQNKDAVNINEVYLTDDYDEELNIVKLKSFIKNIKYKKGVGLYWGTGNDDDIVGDKFSLRATDEDYLNIAYEIPEHLINV